MVPYDALFTGTTRNPAPSRTNARVSDGKLFSKQIGVPNAGRPVGGDGVDPLPRHPVDRHLLDRRDPRQLVAPRHVLAERHQVDLVVAVDRLPRAVQQHDARVLRPVGVVQHGARRASASPPPRSRPRRRRPSAGRWPPPDRAPPLPRRRGRAGPPRVARAAPCAAGRRPRPLPPRSPRPPVGRRPATWRRRCSRPSGTENGISTGARTKPDGERDTAAPRARPPPPPATASTRSAFTASDDERHAPHARDRRQPQERSVVDLRDAERPPAEPAERPGRPDPIGRRSTATPRPTAVSSGCPRRCTAGANSPNTTADAAQSSVSATQAISPNRAIQ